MILKKDYWTVASILLLNLTAITLFRAGMETAAAVVCVALGMDLARLIDRHKRGAP
jgi:hypothetical protein